MARIRTIKPEFFTSEDVVTLSPLARLLFIALWCEADREGRLVWKPKTFKLRYLPADNCDAVDLCQELIDGGLIVLYGDGLAVIPTFGRHQHLNPREAASTLAEPHASATRRPRVSHASARDSDAQVGREGKGREGKGREEESSLRSESSAPLALTNPEPTTLDAKRKERAERLSQITADAIAAYNSTLAKPSGLLAAVSLKVGREKRRDQVAKCLRVVRQICDENYGSTIVTPEFWKDYFTECAGDDFLRGVGPYSGSHANWRPDFEFLTREATVLKVYDRATAEDAA